MTHKISYIEFKDFVKKEFEIKLYNDSDLKKPSYSDEMSDFIGNGRDVIGEINYSGYSKMFKIDKILEYFDSNLSIFKYNRIRNIINYDKYPSYGGGDSYKSYCRLEDLYNAMIREGVLVKK